MRKFLPVFYLVFFVSLAVCVQNWQKHEISDSEIQRPKINPNYGKSKLSAEEEKVILERILDDLEHKDADLDRVYKNLAILIEASPNFNNGKFNATKKLYSIDRALRKNITDQLEDYEQNNYPVMTQTRFVRATNNTNNTCVQTWTIIGRGLGVTFGVIAFGLIFSAVPVLGTAIGIYLGQLIGNLLGKQMGQSIGFSICNDSTTKKASSG